MIWGQQQRYAFVGPNGCGKSTYVRQTAMALGAKGGHLIDPVRYLFHDAGVETPSRQALFDVAEIMCQAGGKEALAVMAYTHGVQVIDGVRRREEIDYLRAKKYAIIYVDTPEEVIQARKMARGESVEPGAPLEDTVRGLRELSDMSVPGDGAMWIPITLSSVNLSSVNLSFT